MGKVNKPTAVYSSAYGNLTIRSKRTSYSKIAANFNSFDLAAFFALSTRTRPNEYGSMTARKDNTGLIKSILCHRDQ